MTQRKNKTKRMLVMADTHCGSVVGLTPPSWQIPEPKPGGLTKRGKYAGLQREGWKWYSDRVRKEGPYDVIVLNGDAIDGKGPRSGGTELITADRQEQVDMATACVQEAMRGFRNDPVIVMTYGTPYHAGTEEDWEADIAKQVGAAKIGSHEWVDLEGVVFDFKHHISGSSIPYGRGTALGRDAVWNVLWAEQDYQPRADVVVRSHVHYFHAMMQDVKPCLGVITPALQAMGTKYGSRMCSGLVSFGFIVFETTGGKLTRFDPQLAHLRGQCAQALKV